ncbi:MAG: NADH-quinone oxidoreductase subunit N, partial [Methanomassiliicoccales archaeon]
RLVLAVFPAFKSDYSLLLAILAVVTIVLGNLAAISQTNLKRMLAYSSIAQAGYILVGLVAGNASGLKGVFFYSLIYVFANLGAFIILMRVESEHQSSEISAFSGLSRRSPLMAAVMTVCFLSLAGIPPMAGFVGKWYLFSGAVQSGYIWLALVGLLMSMVSVYYYLSVVLKMYSGETVFGAITLSLGEKAVIWSCFLLTLAAGIYPAPIIALARLAWTTIGG